MSRNSLLEAGEKSEVYVTAVRDITRRYSQMHRTDKYSEHSSIIWSVFPNG